MFGDSEQPSELPELQLAAEGHRSDVTAGAGGEIALELSHASARGEGTQPGIEDVSLQLRLGEVLGVAGVDGNGQRALAEAISGERRLTHGEVELPGGPDRLAQRREAREARAPPRDRRPPRRRDRRATCRSRSTSCSSESVSRPSGAGGNIRRTAIERQADALVDRFDIRTPSIHARAGTLSGGNIQKLLLARELSFDAKVVVFHKPTYGLDLKTTRAVRETIGGLREHGAALLISTDLDELLEVSDRIAVISRGRIVGIVDNGPSAGEQVGRLMIGDVTLGIEAAA